MGAYFGDPGQQIGDGDGLLPLFHEIRNRNLRDYKEKAQFDSDLAIRQERSRALFDPSGASSTLSTVGNGMGRTTNNNIAYGITAPNPQIETHVAQNLTPAEQAKFGLEKSAQELDRQKIKQSGRLGEERLNIMQEREDLNKNKTEQIHNTKMADMQRKSDEATARLSFAYDQLQGRKDDNAAHLSFLQAKDAADQARHALELAQKDKALSDSHNLTEARIAELQKKYDDVVKTTGVEFDPSGNPIKKTESTTRLPADKNSAFKSSTTKAFTGKNGIKYNIPMDKLEQFKKENPDAQEVK